MTLLEGIQWDIFTLWETRLAEDEREGTLEAFSMYSSAANLSLSVP